MTQEIGSQFFQTNINPDSRAFHQDAKFVADDTSFEENESEQNEGAAGSIRISVDPVSDNYYVLVPDLPLSEGTFPVEE